MICHHERHRACTITLRLLVWIASNLKSLHRFQCERFLPIQSLSVRSSNFLRILGPNVHAIWILAFYGSSNDDFGCSRIWSHGSCWMSCSLSPYSHRTFFRWGLTRAYVEREVRQVVIQYRMIYIPRCITSCQTFGVMQIIRALCSAVTGNIICRASSVLSFHNLDDKCLCL